MQRNVTKDLYRRALAKPDTVPFSRQGNRIVVDAHGVEGLAVSLVSPDDHTPAPVQVD